MRSILKFFTSMQNLDYTRCDSLYIHYYLIMTPLPQYLVEQSFFLSHPSHLPPSFPPFTSSLSLSCPFIPHPSCPSDPSFLPSFLFFFSIRWFMLEVIVAFQCLNEMTQHQENVHIQTSVIKLFSLLSPYMQIAQIHCTYFTWLEPEAVNYFPFYDCQ